MLATSTGGGQSVPLLTYRAAGTLGGGRVVAVEGAGMWRWAFLPPQHQDRDELYGSLWRSLIRWLVTNASMLPSQRLALRTEKSTFNTEENAVLSLLVRENRWTSGTPQVELSGPAMDMGKKGDSPHLSEAPSGPFRQMGTVPFLPLRTVACRPWGNAPGQYHADFGRLAEGRYRVRVVGADKDETSAEAAFDVRGNLKERLDVAAAGKHGLDRSGGRRRSAQRRPAGRNGAIVRRTPQAEQARARRPHAHLGPLVAVDGRIRTLGLGLGA